MNKIQFLEKEMKDLDLNERTKESLRNCLLEGLEILTKKEITQYIEDYLNIMPIYGE